MFSIQELIALFMVTFIVIVGVLELAQSIRNNSQKPIRNEKNTLLEYSNNFEKSLGNAHDNGFYSFRG